MLILTFHGLGAPPPHVEGSELSVWVEQGRYEEILDGLAGRPDVLVTFDDGNLSDVEIALPALRDRGLTATFFVVADRIGRPGYLGGDELRELAGAGMTVGFHGLSHTPWRSLGRGDLETHLDQGSAQLEEALGQHVDETSCPFGSYDRRVLRALRQRGYRRVYTSDGGRTRADAWLQARSTVGADGRLPAALEGSEPVPDRMIRAAKRVVKRVR